MHKNDYIFAAIGHGGFAQETIMKNGFPVVIFNQNPSVSNFQNIWKLYKWLKKEKPDVVHTAAAEANFHGILAAKLAGVPRIVAEEIGFPNHSVKAKLSFRFIYTLADKVICVSESVKNFLVSIKEIKPTDGVVVYNPVSPAKKIHKLQSAKFTIVSVGRLEKVKNQELLLRTFAQLDRQDCELYLVGDGRERKYLENIITELNLKSKVFITGFTPEPEKYLAKADLFVLPSLSEGFGIAAVEAIQYGVPCLCSKVGGLSEIIEEGVSGWLFDPNDRQDFLKQLNKILSLSPDERNAIGEVSKVRILNKFSSEKYVENLENVYESLYD